MNGSKKIRPAIGITVTLIFAIVFFLLGLFVSQQTIGLKVKACQYFRDAGEHGKLWGVVENRSDKLLSNVSIKFVILGQMNIPIGTQDIHIGQIPPHTIYKFDESVSKKFWNSCINKCKLLWIKGEL